MFAKFISKFRTYEPLLSAIKHEYDETIRRLKAHIGTLRPLEGRLAMLDSDHGKRVAALGEEHKQDLQRQRDMIRDLRREIEEKGAEVASARVETDRLKAEVRGLQARLTKEEAARLMLMADLNELRQYKQQQEKFRQGLTPGSEYVKEHRIKELERQLAQAEVRSGTARS